MMAKMKINCVLEHNGSDSILYAEDFAGAYTRGASKTEAIRKMPEEIRRFQLWRGQTPPGDYEIDIVQERNPTCRSKTRTATFCLRQKKAL